MGRGTLEVLERDRAELVLLIESQMGDPEREDDSQGHIGVDERAGLGILPQLPFLSASQGYRLLVALREEAGQGLCPSRPVSGFNPSWAEAALSSA